MFKIITTSFLILIGLKTIAQATDSVTTGTGNANDVYYSFTNGIIKSQSNSDWDLAFEITGYTASILANHPKGITVWQSPYAYNQWASFDSSQHNNWKKMYNNTQNWSLGAFNLHNNNNNDPFDLGWGTYDPNNHIVTGDSIFLVKLANGMFKKLTILSLNSGIYNIKYSDINGANEKIKSIDKANYKNKNFAYFSFTTETDFDREPLTADWDIVFTKYTVFIPTPYNVGGVLINKGMKNAEARNVDVSSNDFSMHHFSDSASIIGYDWKTYNQGLNRYDITSNLAYFVTTLNTTWKMVFTGYKGGTSGTYYFKKTAITSGLNSTIASVYSIYPNPASSLLTINTSNQTEFLNYSIINLDGKMISTGNCNLIDISALPHGAYTIKVLTNHGIQTSKFIKIDQ